MKQSKIQNIKTTFLPDIRGLGVGGGRGEHGRPTHHAQQGQSKIQNIKTTFLPDIRGLGVGGGRGEHGRSTQHAQQTQQGQGAKCPPACQFMLEIKTKDFFYIRATSKLLTGSLL
jgi:hypothetical protein